MLPKLLLNALTIAVVIAVTWAEGPSETGIGKGLLDFLAKEYDLAKIELVNGRFEEISFLKGECKVQVLSLPVKSESTAGSSLDTCSDKFGIKITDEFSHKTFCNVAGIVFDDYYYLDVTANPIITLTVVLESDSSDERLYVPVPLFKTPKKFDSDEEGLKEWAETNKVSLAAPFDLQKVMDLENNNEMTMDFRWLENLLNFGAAIIAGTPTVLNPRPVLLAADTYDKFSDVYLKLRTPPPANPKQDTDRKGWFDRFVSAIFPDNRMVVMPRCF